MIHLSILRYIQTFEFLFAFLVDVYLTMGLFCHRALLCLALGRMLLPYSFAK